ncbi:MAG: FkbM family methyltransferase, partial [Bacteroidota bacterium]|nr:FkbM family methyltransferase [Bacteroidota bacterium]
TVPAQEGSNNTITTISIDDYVAEKRIDKVNLIMIDVEGGEMQVLEGATNVIKTFRPVLIFENHSLHNDWSRGLQNSNSVQFVQNFGYKVFSIRDFHNNIDTTDMRIELIPVEHTFINGPPHGFNLLAVADDSLIENDLFKIVKDYSPKLLLHKTEKEFLPGS